MATPSCRVSGSATTRAGLRASASRPCRASLVPTGNTLWLTSRPQAPEPASQSAISPASAWAPGCSARNTAGAAGAPFNVIGAQRNRPAARCSPSSSPSPGSRYGTRSSFTASSTRPSGTNQHTSWPLCAKAAAVTEAHKVSPKTSMRMASPCSYRLPERALWERAQPAKGRHRRPAGYQRRLKKRI